jgi:hypothetical protein
VTEGTQTTPRDSDIPATELLSGIARMAAIMIATELP